MGERIGVLEEVMMGYEYAASVGDVWTSEVLDLWRLSYTTPMP